MKTFTQILTESKKTYQFKIGLAGEMPEGFQDKLETVLQMARKLQSKKDL